MNKLCILLTLFIICSCVKKQYLPIYGDIPINTKVNNMTELINLSETHNVKRLLFVANDFVAVEINSSSLTELSLLVNNKQWYIQTENLPRTANLKNINYIAVESDYKEFQLSYFDGVENQTDMSAYNKIKNSFISEGASEKNGHIINKYIGSISTESKINDSQQLIILKNGNEIHSSIDNIIFNHTHWTINNEIITIIWDDPPKNSIKDIYSEILNIEPLLLILVDGLGYNMLENAKARNRAGYFGEISFLPQRVVYPPKTKTALQIIGNDINNNEFFNDLVKEKVYIIQDDKFFFSSKYPIILNIDRNNNGFIDDEILDIAMDLLEHDLDLLFVHFHSIDDVAHEFGPYAEQTIEQIEIISNYVKKLLDKWVHGVIIFSDHGLHSKDFKGMHGYNRLEDMVGILHITTPTP